MVLVHQISHCILFLRCCVFCFSYVLYYFFFRSFSHSFFWTFGIVKRRPFGMVKHQEIFMIAEARWIYVLKWSMKMLFLRFRYKCFAGCWSKWNVGSFHCKIHIVISRSEMQHMKWHFMSRNESKSLLVAWWKKGDMEKGSTIKSLLLLKKERKKDKESTRKRERKQKNKNKNHIYRKIVPRFQR